MMMAHKARAKKYIFYSK